MSNIWDKYLDPQDAEVYSSAGLGKNYGFGERPALIIVDVMYGFTADKPMDATDSIEEYPLSCGPISWEGVKNISKVLTVAREVNIPVFFTTMEGLRNYSNDKVGIKGNFFDHPSMLQGEKGTKIIEEIAPIDGEIAIDKKKPSSFFGTALLSYLTAEKVDTLIVAGTTTSGCIRATVVDAFSYNYNVIVPEECVFDRGITTHAMNLFDMQFKYADVLPTNEVIEKLKTTENNRG